MGNGLTEVELDEVAKHIMPKVDNFVASLNDANDKVVNSMGTPKGILEPSLGLRPRWVAEEERFEEVDAAIKRYTEIKKFVPREWTDEWNYLYDRKLKREMDGSQGDREKIRSSRLCVKYRTVVNDAVVGEWKDIPEIRPPTYDGIVQWMKHQGGYDLSQLIKDCGWDKRLVNYGMRQQFWVPTSEDLIKEAQEAQQGVKDQGAIQGRVVVCKDDCGDCGLTKGKEYGIVTYLDLGMVRVVNDKGIEQDYFQDRFHSEKVEKFFNKFS